jgi:hypothetical protein
MIKTRIDKHNGVTYRKIESSKLVEGALTFGREKLVLLGRPAIETMDGSYKFGDQVQVTLFNRAGTLRRRPRVEYAGKYERIEIFFDKDEFTQLCKAYLNGHNTSKNLLQTNN